MFSWRRKVPPSSKLAFVGAVVCAGAAAWLVTGQLAPGPASDPLVRVVAATRDLAAGTRLQPGDVTTRPVEAGLVPPGALTGEAEAVGRSTVTPFLQGEVVAGTRLAAAAGPSSIQVPPGLVGVMVSPDSAPAGLGEGDRVDILATYATARPYTTAVAEDVAILRVAASGAAFGEGSGPAVTLVLDPYVAREVIRADVTAHISLVVRGYAPVP
ncbi:MAG: Flp pilus assembly protein CpaB [Actinomycetota bacterium]